MANGNKGKRVVKGGTKMSNKPDYEGINFKNKDIERLIPREMARTSGAQYRLMSTGPRPVKAYLMRRITRRNP
jgi:hypothetical protein|tara:strand:+ start:649 stop:867 length:219 start_codon:yes stop_codon:yes gene_type:complete